MTLAPFFLVSLLPHTWLLPFENRLVFVPSRPLVATPKDYGLEFEHLLLEASDGVGLMAWAIPFAEDAPWLIYFHGNGENVSHYLPLTTEFHALGLNVLMLEYRGYGESEGVPSEAGLYRDARAAYDWLIHKGVAAQNIILYGFSLGSGVATNLASEVETGALILEAPYTSIPEVARALYRIVPLNLMRNRFASRERIANVDAPLLVIHSPEDRTVPFNQGRELFDLAEEPKTFVEVEGGHLAMLGDKPDGEVLGEIRMFLEKHLIAYSRAHER